MGARTTAKDAGVDRVLHWYARASIDYGELFLRLYIAYNAWYKRATGETNDRMALQKLKRRFWIWAEYCEGTALHDLGPYMERLAEMTQRTPFVRSLSRDWDGEVHDAQDWQSLIEFWYAVRCLLVHGEKVDQPVAYLAYNTLKAYMDELVVRMKDCLRALEALSADKAGALTKQQLYQRYIDIPDIWQVDRRL